VTRVNDAGRQSASSGAVTARPPHSASDDRSPDLALRWLMRNILRAVRDDHRLQNGGGFVERLSSSHAAWALGVGSIRGVPSFGDEV